MTARPTTKKRRDYNDDPFGDAFPLQFLYGHPGLQTYPAVMELKEKTIQERDQSSKNYFDTESCVFMLHFSISSSKI
jgi:hypothetical protein